MTNGVPLADQIADKGEQLDYGKAFELLSKPTAELTDTELLLVANDLRRKRIQFLNGVKDKAGTKPRVAAPKPTEEEKNLRTAHLKEQLKLGDLNI